MDTLSSILLGTLFLIVCVLLIVVILLQKGRGGGLGAAFGGGGQSAFGTRTGDVFTWITIVLTGLFLLLAIGTSVAIRPEQKALPAPIITPSALAAQVGVDGKISVHISGEKGSEFWYTTDGRDPVPNKEGTHKFGTVPVQVEPGTTVKAVAVRIGRTSQVAVVYYPTEAEKAKAAAQEALPQLPGSADESTLPASGLERVPTEDVEPVKETSPESETEPAEAA